MKISLYTDFLYWLENHMGSCIYKKVFGIECPGCGLQRSFIELLKGNFWESFLLYPAIYPLVFTLNFLILHIIFKFKNGALILKISFIFMVLIMLSTYIVKITTN